MSDKTLLLIWIAALIVWRITKTWEQAVESVSGEEGGGER